MVTQANPPCLIRAKDGAKRFNVSLATWWNWNNPKSRHYKPDFPKPIKVSANVTGWLENEVNAYIEKLAAGK